jgi:hypothetical protein
MKIGMMKTRIGSFTMNKPFLDTLHRWPWKPAPHPTIDEWQIVDIYGKVVASIDSPWNLPNGRFDAPNIAIAMSLAPELIEALQYCECELTLYQSLAEQSENPQAWYDAIARARTVLNKLRGTQEAQPTLF